MTNSHLRPIPTPEVSFASATGLPAVYLRGARKSFGQNEILRGVDLTISKGEVLSLLGPSGAGKSTILRCLATLDKFDGGELAYGSLRVCTNDPQGKAVYDREAMRKARMKFGIVFQDYNLFPHFSVMRNVTDAPICVQGRDPEEVEEQARGILRKLGLAERADMVPCQLSGGQQQRVAIARALCMNPNVLFFDEATSALDPKLTEEMLKIIRDLAGEGMAIGIVTHEVGFARDASDRIAVMLDGEIAEVGKPKDVLGSPRDERVAAFLSHSME